MQTIHSSKRLFSKRLTSNVGLLLTLLLSLSVACGGSKEEGNDSNGEDTTGGETAAGMTQPPGSVEPGEEDDSFDGDDEDAGGTGTDKPASNPWGQTKAEKCKAPSRKTLSASTQGSVKDGIRQATNDPSSARTTFQKALSKDPNAYSAAYNLGVLSDREGRATQALEFYRQALRIQGDYEHAVRGIMTIQLRRGNKTEAVSFVRSVAGKYPTNLHLQALHSLALIEAGQFDAAWDAARLALNCDERFVPALTAIVLVSMAQGRKELASSTLDQALSIDDNNAELHFLKGQALKDEPGRLRDALTEFRRAVELQPQYAEARSALGAQMLVGGNYKEALQHFEVAAKLLPTQVAVHLNLGDAYRATKNWQKAKDAFDKALSMDSNLAQAHFNLGLMYQSAGENFPGLDAVQSLEKAKAEFLSYRNLMGPRLKRSDLSQGYIEDLDRQITRTKKRIERDKARAERAARAAAEGGEE